MWSCVRKGHSSIFMSKNEEFRDFIEKIASVCDKIRVDFIGTKGAV